MIVHQVWDIMFQIKMDTTENRAIQFSLVVLGFAANKAININKGGYLVDNVAMFINRILQNMYNKISNIRRSKSQNLNVSHLGLQ